ncbi:DUF4845 domain-containing protein [Crenobacter caeni]|uniref:DUF4845 domain-containing protein n=1 Tax=Crenobacter caeni TaxID=2705474 RepID=A0A6B2KUL3_9NEIS|nr:DUF4845 domain-containing protein [Crenobacter caeni]NDV13945.1 DUF4845 domain-containing protein [Crenobacter caeni]
MDAYPTLTGDTMRHRQAGLSLMSLLAFLLVAGTVLLTFFKVVPVYAEYFEVKNALNDMVKEPAREGEWGVRKDFTQRAGVADIKSVRANDLLIVAPAGVSPVIQAAWRREVPLAYNVSLVFDFNVKAGNKAGEQILQ